MKYVFAIALALTMSACAKEKSEKQADQTEGSTKALVEECPLIEGYFTGETPDGRKVEYSFRRGADGLLYYAIGDSNFSPIDGSTIANHIKASCLAQSVFLNAADELARVKSVSILRSTPNTIFVISDGQGATLNKPNVLEDLARKHNPSQCPTAYGVYRGDIEGRGRNIKYIVSTDANRNFTIREDGDPILSADGDMRGYGDLLRFVDACVDGKVYSATQSKLGISVQVIWAAENGLMVERDDKPANALVLDKGV